MKVGCTSIRPKILVEESIFIVLPFVRTVAAMDYNTSHPEE
jgi:hypothetical protein